VAAAWPPRPGARFFAVAGALTACHHRL